MIQSSGRIYSLDALRAVMMILGIVLHSAETYSSAADQLWPKDPHTTSRFFTYLSSIIHIFRMPVFFMISGFFGAMLYYRRGVKSMLTQRFKRILLPFITFLLLLHPVLFFSYDFMIDAFGAETVNNGSFRFLPNITYHLWFLYYLVLITFFTVFLTFILNRIPRLKKLLKSFFQWLFSRQWLFIPFASFLLFLLLVWMWNYWASTPLTFKPEGSVFLFYLLFYLAGWILYTSQDLFVIIKKYASTYTVIGFTIYTLKFIFKDYIGDVTYGGLNTFIGWFLILGITGLFMKHLEKHSINWRYVSDASYWVYLIHLPFTLLIPSVIYQWPVSAGVKFFLVMAGTTIVSFGTYHYLVRGTFIGQFLNGRKYTIKKSRP